MIASSRTTTQRNARMKPDTPTDINDLLTQIRDAILEGNSDRKTIKGYGRTISQNLSAIREGRTGIEAQKNKDPLTPIQRATVNEAKIRFKNRRIANPKYSQLSVSKEVFHEWQRKEKDSGFADALALNHRVYLEIKREDIGLPPF